MKAYVFTEKGKIELRELPAPRLSEKSPEDRRAAILRPRYLAPCASDVHTVYAGPGPRRENLVLGHEGLAEIVAVGEEVRDFRPGELVAVSAVMPDVPDGTGHEHMPFSGSKLGRNINGMWSETFYVPDADQNLAHIPDGVSPEAALMAVDMMPTGFTAAEDAGAGPGKTAVVIGLGAVGLMALAAAKKLGDARVIAVCGERSQTALSLAREYGADCLISYRDGRILYQREKAFPDSMFIPDGSASKDSCISDIEPAQRHPSANSTKSAAVDRVLDLTGGAGVDCVMVCGGGPETLMQACDLARYGTGVVSNVTYLEGEGAIGLPIFSLGRGMAGKTFHFSFCRGGRRRLEEMLSLIADASIPDPGRMVTHRLHGADQIPEALRLMRDKPGGLIKVMVEIP